MKTKGIAFGGIAASLYIVLSFVSNSFGMASGPIQLRISESLYALATLGVEAVPGLFIGCLLFNLFSGCAIWDCLFGSLATLIGAFGSWKLRNTKYIWALPPIVSNSVILPIMMNIVYQTEQTVLYLALIIFIEEALACGLLGILLRKGLKKHVR